MNSKVNVLKKKWLAYNNCAESYNSEFSPGRILATPTLDDVKAYGIDNVFWNMGALSHLDEPWVVNLNVQQGIQAYLTLTHCHDKLRRIYRETRQAIQWVIKIGGDLYQIENCLIAETRETDVSTKIQQRLTEIFLVNHIPLSVLQLIFGCLVQKFFHLWMKWNTNCKKLLHWSKNW
ncbi:hypothetical protein PGTUg99_022575 [Puccinia graminis f. sp. tritici]|uniref:Uncharacterized protein n=1 Tax=Puccinia graminis f. sp. tritici TaxID=56615 RepID=A0A5B0PMZ1_PUCGR|nr:hypothetical protein PGTUg99_022575 [Puccinia graminis f. sp. tritici]